MSGASGTPRQRTLSFFVREVKTAHAKKQLEFATEELDQSRGLSTATSSQHDGGQNELPAQEKGDNNDISSPKLGFSKLLRHLLPSAPETPKEQKSFASEMVQKSFGSIWSRGTTLQERKQQARKKKAQREAQTLMKALLQAEAQACLNTICKLYLTSMKKRC